MWFNEILTRNSLHHPDGRPLYQYAVNDAEFKGIARALGERGERHARYWSHQESAEFCVYIAEWWRRFYSEGHWSWEAPLKPLQLTPWHPLLGQATRSQIVRRGLQYLERELIELDSRIQYLGTLATEGGLPLRLIAQENSLLRGIFGDLFASLNHFDYSLSDLERRARYLSQRLSQTYQQVDTLPRLFAGMAMSIWQFSRLIEAGEEPISALNQKFPGWQHQLPMRVDEQGARTFFQQILGDAAQARSVEIAHTRVSHHLVEQADGWELTAEVHLPQNFPDAQLARLLETSIQTLPFRISLHTRVEHRARPLAVVSRDRQQTYRVDPLNYESVATGQAATRPIYISALSGANQWAAPTTPLSEALSDGTWVFSLPTDERPARLLGTDSVRTQYDEVLLALPEHISFSPESVDLSDALGTIDALNRRIYRVRDTVSLRDHEGASWRIRCADEYAADPQIWVRGASCAHQHARGLRIFEHHPEIQAAIDQPIRNGVQWYAAGNQTTWNQASYGDGKLRIYDDEGQIALQQNACKLPVGARIYVVPRNKNQDGRLILEQFGEVELGTASTDISLRIEQEDDRQIIHCTYLGDDSAPADWTLRMRWHDQGETSLIVPFPGAPSRFVARGRALPDGASWNVHALDQVCAELTVEQRFEQAPFLYGELFAADMDDALRDAAKFEATLQPELVGTQFTGRYRLPLGRIRSFIELALAGTMDLDAHIRLTILWDGYAQTLKLNRYEGLVEQKNATTFGLLPPPVDLLGEASVELSAFRFHDMTRVLKLTATTENEWLGVPEMRQPGTWCVVGTRHQHLSHRPFIFTQPGQIFESEWAKICEIDERDERLQGFHELFERMARQPAHPAWAQLAATFSAARELPATTFDALDCLVQVPRASAMALIIAGHERIDRWWDELEELPFAWYLLSYHDWAQALKIHHAYIREQFDQAGISFDAAKFYEPLLASIAAHLGGASPIFAHIDEAMSIGLKLSDGDRQGLMIARQNEPILLHLLDDELRELLARKARHDVHWPTELFDVDLEQFTLFKKLRLTLSEPWRNAVMNAPVLAAAAAACGFRLGRPDIIRIRKLRDFDPTWFNLCYRVSLARALVALEESPTMTASIEDSI